MKRDTIYDTHRQPVPPFEFNDQVAAVFDDMLQRSIPLYHEIIRRQAQLVAEFFIENTTIYDLGCSTGNVGLAICEAMGATPFRMIAVDNSPAMLAIYDERRRALPAGDRITLVDGDVTRTAIEDAGISLAELARNGRRVVMPVEQRPETAVESHEFTTDTGTLKQEPLQQVGVSRHSCESPRQYDP